MPPEDDPDPASQGPDDVVEFGPSRTASVARRWWKWLLLMLVAIAAAVMVAQSNYANLPAASPPPQGPPTPAAPPSVEPTGDTGDDGEPQVTDLGHPLLDVSGEWELFARGPEAIVRLELARGRITRTPVPGLASSGPVSFVVDRDRAVVRPLDYVPGYEVRDGARARVLSGGLSEGGPALPGPDPGTFWVQADSNGTKMAVVDAEGRFTGTSIAIPLDLTGIIESDGTGNLIVSGTGGTYLVTPGGVRRITTGRLLAIGPTRWLSVECDANYECVRVVVDRGSGTGSVLGGFDGQISASSGLISPDGTTAALRMVEEGETTRVHLLDLASGADRVLDVTVGPWFDPGSMAWSPDSRWLFVASSNGRLAYVRVATGELQYLAIPLAAVDQIAVRTAPG